MSGSFDFMTAYRKLAPPDSQGSRGRPAKGAQPVAPASHHDAAASTTFVALAFQLEPHSPEVAAWLEPAIKEVDPQFSLEIDKAEAGRLASLLLQGLTSRVGAQYSALAVLTASFCGKRSTVDDNAGARCGEGCRDRPSVRQHRKLASITIPARSEALR